MPAQIREWPTWAEYGDAPAEAKDPEFLSTKKKLIEQFGEASLRRSWIKVCKDLQAITDEISAKGRSIIPVLDARKVLTHGFAEDEKKELRRVGAFVIKGVIPQSEADDLYQDLRTYVANNGDKIKGWPEESPSMLILYDSPTQNTLRSHPNQLCLQRMLNELWHDSTGETSSDPLVYYDGVRDRPPGQEFLGLGPHIDAGSLCRWADPGYQKVYSNIFSGYPEKHDPYDLALRKDADQEMYKGIAHSTVLRSFQGWTALTKTAPGEGTILVYPNVAIVIAYVLLRPFFAPPEDEVDIMDAEKWTFDDSTGWFPGTFKPESQRLSRSSHPHLQLDKCLVHMPRIEAGDTVWWHADICHAVDAEHNGSTNASVAYIATCPTTPINKKYVKRQLASTLSGQPPPDYIEGNGLDETKLKGYVGLDGLSDQVRKAFGFDH